MRWFLVFLPLIFVLSFARAQDADGYMLDGEKKMKDQDLEGALAAYTYAISVSPDDINCRLKRAVVEMKMNFLDNALFDCNHCFVGNRFDSKLLSLRSHISLGRGDWNLGSADAFRAYDLAPNDVIVVNALAHVQLIQGKMEEAFATVEHALEIDPKNSTAKSIRGEILETKGDLAGALDDLRDAATAQDQADHSGLRWLIWVVQARQGQLAQANSDLAQWMINDQGDYPRDWHEKVGRFLLDRISEADLQAAAVSPTKPYEDHGRHCEAYYYAGIKHELAGDKATAADDFQRSLATKMMNYVEYTNSLAELKALGVTPK